MKKEVLTSRQGYAIPCHNCLNGKNRAVIVCHGFGSSKESPMVQALNETLPRHGIGVYSFDFPSHGESPVWQEGLRVPFCLEDLAVVEEHVRAQLPGVRVGYFGSSFGAYITLLYLASGWGQGRRAFLRSAAVTMPKLVQSWVDARAEADLDRRGYFVPDYDYVREMRITRAFLQDLADHDLFRYDSMGPARLQMIHGGQDDVAPAEDARRFARQFGARLVEIPGGEHRLMGPGELEQVLESALAFFLAPE